jgi:hypothetical protein
VGIYIASGIKEELEKELKDFNVRTSTDFQIFITKLF